MAVGFAHGDLALSHARIPCYELGVNVVENLAALIRMPHGCLGLVLVAVFWPLNWLLPEETMHSSFFFFPLWLGYVLVVDALVL